MLSDKQKVVILELVKAIKTKQEIAKEYGISARTITNWQNTEDFQQEYKKQMDLVMNEASAEALQTITDLMRNAKSEMVKLNACKDILSRAGYDATAKSKVDLETPNNIVINITDDDEAEAGITTVIED